MKVIALGFNALSGYRLQVEVPGVGVLMNIDLASLILRELLLGNTRVMPGTMLVPSLVEEPESCWSPEGASIDDIPGMEG